MSAIDILADAREWLAAQGDRVQTHGETCHRWHPACLVARLVREVERLRLTDEELEAVAYYIGTGGPDGVDATLRSLLERHSPDRIAKPTKNGASPICDRSDNVSDQRHRTQEIP